MTLNLRVSLCGLASREGFYVYLQGICRDATENAGSVAMSYGLLRNPVDIRNALAILLGPTRSTVCE